MNRRHFLNTSGLALLAGSSVFAAASAQASDYPKRAIRLMVGFPPGGSTDGPVRVLAANAATILGQPIVVENRVGAGGVMPAYGLQSAPADGYTLGIIALGVFRLPFRTEIKWSPIDDIDYVVGLTGYSFGIVVPTDSPIKTWEDYVAYAKAHPGELTYASPGPVTTNHLTMEQISRAAGIELNHVPYKGSGESMLAVLSGQVQSAAETSAWAPHVESGKLRLIVVWGDKRMSRFPDVPTLKEKGIDLVQTSPWGIGVRAGTDPAIIGKLHDAFRQAMQMPNFAEALAVYDMEPMYMDPEQYTRFARETMAREKNILEALGLNTR
ncbi:MAG TPA: tripartite tricarboxylate transporter substrate binding protein [Burkholderiaceae bacterium]|nr:tripartite tricarboxylate transporter substrate binding protein [Burkholderiaceae bacterium]